MTAGKKAQVYRLTGNLVSAIDVYAIIVMLVLTAHVGATEIKRRIVYNYDPTTQFTEQEAENRERISKLEGKVEDIQQRSREDAKVGVASNVEGRLSRLEQAQDTNKELLIAIVVGLVGLIAEAFQRRVAGKSREASDEC